jgi:hypothetical protein
MLVSTYTSKAHASPVCLAFLPHRDPVLPFSPLPFIQVGMSHSSPAVRTRASKPWLVHSLEQ